MLWHLTMRHSLYSEDNFVWISGCFTVTTTLTYTNELHDVWTEVIVVSVLLDIFSLHIFLTNVVNMICSLSKHLL